MDRRCLLARPLLCQRPQPRLCDRAEVGPVGLRLAEHAQVPDVLFELRPGVGEREPQAVLRERDEEPHRGARDPARVELEDRADAGTADERDDAPQLADARAAVTLDRDRQADQQLEAQPL